MTDRTSEPLCWGCKENERPIYCEECMRKMQDIASTPELPTSKTVTDEEFFALSNDVGAITENWAQHRITAAAALELLRRRLGDETTAWQVALPEITPSLREEFGSDLRLIDNDCQWTQEAVDFAAMLQGVRAEKASGD